MSSCVVALAICLASLQQTTFTGPVEGRQEGVTAPVLIHQVEPRYPHSIFGGAPSGEVEVSLTVDPHGMPQNVAVRKPAKSDKLNKAAIAAVQQYRFKPATKGGNPVAVALFVEVSFQVR